MYRIGEGIYQIKMPVPASINTKGAPKEVNLYLFVNSSLTLIDTGPSGEKSFSFLRKMIKTIGFQVKDIGRVIISHGHPDHFGLAHRIQEASSATIYVHKDDALMLSNFCGERKKRARQILLQMESDWGFPQGKISEEIIQEIMFPPIAENCRGEIRVVKDGDVISQRRLKFEVIHCPGHSMGSICLFLRGDKENLLLTGDHLLSHITPNPAHSLSDYLESLKKVQDMEVDLCLTGHGQIYRDHRTRIRKIFSHHTHRLNRIRSFLKVRKTVYELTMDFLGDLCLPPSYWNIILSVLEVSGHLDLLIKRGDIEWITENAVRYYYKKNGGKANV